jgi:PTS system cellobiose-specific IIA component
MDENEAEAIVMNLVVHGGDAKSSAVQAIKAAREGDFATADDLMAQAQDSLNQAHEFQSAQIRGEINGDNHEPVSLIMVHGQDHLMNAITACDLAAQIIALCRQLDAAGALGSPAKKPTE